MVGQLAAQAQRLLGQLVELDSSGMFKICALSSTLPPMGSFHFAGIRIRVHDAEDRSSRRRGAVGVPAAIVRDENGALKSPSPASRPRDGEGNVDVRLGEVDRDHVGQQDFAHRLPVVEKRPEIACTVDRIGRFATGRNRGKRLVEQLVET